MIGPSGHHLINIRPERQYLLPAIAGPIQFDGNEGRVLDLYAAALSRRLQPPGAVRFSPEDAGKQAHQFLPCDWTAAVQPSTVAADQER
jgi:hypothetical protein